MTLEAFAAWLRGFMDAIDGVPTPAQVERVRAELVKVAAPEAKPVQGPEPVVLGQDLQKFLDELREYQPPPTSPYPWPTVPLTPTLPAYPWDTQPFWPWGGGGTWC